MHCLARLACPLLGFGDASLSPSHISSFPKSSRLTLKSPSVTRGRWTPLRCWGCRSPTARRRSSEISGPPLKFCRWSSSSVVFSSTLVQNMRWRAPSFTCPSAPLRRCPGPVKSLVVFIGTALQSRSETDVPNMIFMLH